MATEQRVEMLDADGYADNAMTWLLGSHAKAKLLTVFVGKEYTDLSASSVSELADIHPSTFNEHVGDLVDLGVVVETRKAGNTQLYQLNPDSQVADDLQELQSDLASVVAEEHTES